MADLQIDNTLPVALFYGSSTCYTEMAAEKIQQWFNDNTVLQVHLFNVASDDLHQLENYQRIIFGIPTWDYGELQEDWEIHWQTLCELDFTDKTVAIYGLGDQIGYPEWFQDAMGYLHRQVVAQGATVIGFWPNEGYQFESSQALTDDKQYFVGLALDDENEFDHSEQRINDWCKLLLTHWQTD